MKTYYDIIRLSPTAAQAEVDARLAEMARREIPEHLQASFAQIRRTLGDAQRRRAYDAAIGIARSEQAAPSAASANRSPTVAAHDAADEGKAAPLAAQRQSVDGTDRPGPSSPLADEAKPAPRREENPYRAPQTDANPYRAPVSSLHRLDADEAPPLYNPLAAGLWSLLFSPIFGSYLHWQNCLALEDEEGAKTQRGLFYVFVGVIALLVLLGLFAPNIAEKINTGGLLLFVLWWVMAGRKHQMEVRERFGKDYPRRSMAKAVLVAVGILAAVFALIMLILFVGAMLGVVDLNA